MKKNVETFFTSMVIAAPLVVVTVALTDVCSERVDVDGRFSFLASVANVALRYIAEQ